MFASPQKVVQQIRSPGIWRKGTCIDTGHVSRKEVPCWSMSPTTGAKGQELGKPPKAQLQEHKPSKVTSSHSVHPPSYSLSANCDSVWSVLHHFPYLLRSITIHIQLLKVLQPQQQPFKTSKQAKVGLR